MLNQERGRKSKLAICWTLIAVVAAMIVVMHPYSPQRPKRFGIDSVPSCATSMVTL